VPLGAGRVLLSERSLWRFYTEPELHMEGAGCIGRVGESWEASSTINACCGCAGSRQNTMRGATPAVAGWGYEDVLPFLKRCETYIGGDPARRGAEGAVNVVEFKPDDLGSAFHRACLEAGIPATADTNGAQYEGVGILQDQHQAGPAPWRPRGYLYPRAVARRWRSVPCASPPHPRRQRRAVGVEYGEGGQRRFVRARREVIVSAGTVQSPHLLELSASVTASDWQPSASTRSPICRRWRELSRPPAHPHIL